MPIAFTIAAGIGAIGALYGVFFGRSRWFLPFQIICGLPLLYLWILPPGQGSGTMVLASLLVPILLGLWFVVSVLYAIVTALR